MEQFLQEIYRSVVEGQKNEVVARVEEALQAGFDARSILDEGMILAMTEVGRLFEVGEYYLPEMLLAARAMQTGLTCLKTFLAGKPNPICWEGCNWHCQRRYA